LFLHDTSLQSSEQALLLLAGKMLINQFQKTIFLVHNVDLHCVMRFHAQAVQLLHIPACRRFRKSGQQLL